MKVSPSIEDSFIPMEAEAEEALQEHKRKRNEHWARMRRAREFWLIEHMMDSPNTFWSWLETECGLRPNRDIEGNITEGYVVTDEKLYTLFLLKFST